MRAAIPDDEDRRMASLRRLKILDTEPEDRFDRITRLAAALFHVPVALVSLVDEDRQWFKACVGITVKETPRDQSFCAHVVHDREPIIVPDTFQDARFADSPLVTNSPASALWGSAYSRTEATSARCASSTRARACWAHLSWRGRSGGHGVRELQVMAAVR
jgi:hypothetical protein